jgi:hypothetical protein
MSTEFTDAASAVEEVATTAVKAAKKVASRPVRTARKQVRVIERRSARVARTINHRFTARLRELTPEKVDVWGLELNGKFPEKAAVKGLHLVKARARRDDNMGVVAKRTLRLLHASFKEIARMATRFEEASALTAPHAAAPKPATRTVTSRRRAVRRAA